MSGGRGRLGVAAVWAHRAGPPVALCLGALWVAGRLCGAPAPRADEGRGEARPPASEAPWRAVRARLEEAAVLRRAGRTEEALAAYLAVVESAAGRSDDREEASMWAARLRLERGEWSAFVDLERWVEGRPDPARLARVALLLGRIVDAAEGTEGAREVSPRAPRLGARVVHQLAVMGRVHDSDGERARRWSERLASSGARIFFLQRSGKVGFPAMEDVSTASGSLRALSSDGEHTSPDGEQGRER